ncbi:antileukoproteinase [Varanus komodoensis]|uniref:antileukoproteinase n=1 Tax=Varanus komodoensis TaxID=61221 RepID=UPI001CF7D846|nr:antileukoproteinase [Varanus komodoensis]
MKILGILLFWGLLTLWSELPPAYGQVLVKPGYCRYVRVRCAMPNPPIRCRKDSVCDGAKKCCVTACGTACVDPVFEKPGFCPIVEMPCLALNPPNSCSNDETCYGPKKCCDTGCGKHCVHPEFG